MGALFGRTPIRSSSTRAVLLGLAVIVGSVVFAVPGQAVPAQRSGGETQDQAAIVVDAGRSAVLPFARLDLAILVLGGAVLTVAATSAPLLFRPLRRTARVGVSGAAASEPFALAEQAGAAHAAA